MFQKNLLRFNQEHLVLSGKIVIIFTEHSIFSISQKITQTYLEYHKTEDNELIIVWNKPAILKWSKEINKFQFSIKLNNLRNSKNQFKSYHWFNCKINYWLDSNKLWLGRFQIINYKCRQVRASYNSSWKSPTPLCELAAPEPMFMFMWLSMIWNSSPGWGIRPDSILDQTGMSLRLISKAPVLISWVSTALQRKKVIIPDMTSSLSRQWKGDLTCVYFVLQHPGSPARSLHAKEREGVEGGEDHEDQEYLADAEQLCGLKSVIEILNCQKIVWTEVNL